MLARVLLIVMQIIAGWFGANALMPYMQIGDLQLLVFAAAAAVIVWLVGLIASLVLRGIGRPGGGALASTLALALVAAAAAIWGPQLIPSVPWGRIDGAALTLAGAVIGYIFKK